MTIFIPLTHLLALQSSSLVTSCYRCQHDDMINQKQMLPWLTVNFHWAFVREMWHRKLPGAGGSLMMLRSIFREIVSSKKCKSIGVDRFAIADRGGQGPDTPKY